MDVAKIHDYRLALGITTSVLFDMSEPDAVFRRYGVDGYRSYMKERIDEPLKTGKAFEWAKDYAQHPHHDIVLFSRNSTLTAVRALKTLIQHDVIPRRFAFTNGQSPTDYLRAYQIDVFFSANEDDVRQGRRVGVPSVHFEPDKLEAHALKLKKALDNASNITPLNPNAAKGSNIVTLTNKHKNAAQRQHYIGDFDGVLADDAGEEYFREHGLEPYQQFEKSNLYVPVGKGPLFPLFEKLSHINQSAPQGPPYVISMATARGVYAGLRYLNTLAHWDMEPNGDVLCLAALDKGPFLRIMKARYKHSEFFVDDGAKNVKSAQEHGIFSGRVLPPPDDEFKPAS